MKAYSAFLKTPALLEPHYQIVWCHIRETGSTGCTPLQRSSRCILQPHSCLCNFCDSFIPWQQARFEDSSTSWIYSLYYKWINLNKRNDLFLILILNKYYTNIETLRLFLMCIYIYIYVCVCVCVCVCIYIYIYILANI